MSTKDGDSDSSTSTASTSGLGLQVDGTPTQKQLAKAYSEAQAGIEAIRIIHIQASQAAKLPCDIAETRDKLKSIIDELAQSFNATIGALSNVNRAGTDEASAFYIKGMQKAMNLNSEADTLLYDALAETTDNLRQHQLDHYHAQAQAAAPQQAQAPPQQAQPTPMAMSMPKDIEMLRPEPLAHDAKLPEYRDWVRKWTGYSRALGMDQEDILTQRTWFLACLDSRLTSLVTSLSNDGDPIERQPAGPGGQEPQSLMKLVDDKMMEVNPVALRRKMPAGVAPCDWAPEF